MTPQSAAHPNDACPNSSACQLCSCQCHAVQEFQLPKDPESQQQCRVLRCTRAQDLKMPLTECECQLQSCRQHKLSNQGQEHKLSLEETRSTAANKMTYHVGTDVAKAQNAEEERDSKGQRDKAVPHAMPLGTWKQLVGQAAVACSAMRKVGMRILQRGSCYRMDLQRICCRGLTLCQVWRCQVTPSAMNPRRKQPNCYLKPSAAC